MLFSTTPPPPQDKYVAPKYLDDSLGLKLLGYKNTGERNVWGEITSWINTTQAFTGDLVMKEVAKNMGASDTAENLKATQDRDLQKLFTVGQVAENVATGNYAGAVSSGVRGVASTYGTPNSDLSNDSEMIPQYRNGAKISSFTKKVIGGPHEDLDMIDRKTGKKHGEVSYGETIFSKDDTSMMEEWFEKGDKKKLGEATYNAMKKHEENEGDNEKMSGGGKLTKEKAAQILKEGKVYNKALTEKQRTFFETIANGKKYVSGGKIKQYAGGGKPQPAPWSLNIDPNEQIDFSGVEELGWDAIEPIQTGSQKYLSTAPTQDMAFKMDAPISVDPEDMVTPEGFDEGGKNFLDKIGGVDQLWNATKTITGLLGTKEKIPTYKRTADWEQYIKTWKQMKDQGFTPEEMAAASQAIHSGLALDLNNIRETSGGNSAFALGAGGGAVNRFVSNSLKLNAADADLRRQNFGEYGKWLEKDESINQDQFQRDYDLVVKNKTAASELAQSGIQGAFDAADYNKAYGDDSLYAKYLKSQIKANEDNNIDFTDAINNMLKDWLPNNSAGTATGFGH